MSEPSYLETHLAQSLDEFVRLAPEARAHAVHAAIPDLNFFFDDGRAIADRDAPPRTRALAQSLYAALAEASPGDGASRTLRERIITNALLRAEADRDQNVYLGKLFTRSLTRAVPDVMLQPVSAAETAAALRWARSNGVPVTLRGAASTAMGGAVANDGGLTLDLSRMDAIEIDAAAGVCVVGAGARLRTIHARLAERGLALCAYPSNLGGTLAGWFATGGIGMNAYGGGRARDSVRAADVMLPDGEHVRFHDDGRIDVPEGAAHRRLSAGVAAEWFRGRGCEPVTIADLAGSEGVFCVLLSLTVRVEPRPELAAFLLSFEREADGLEAVEWLLALELGSAPANVKLLSGSHLHHTRRVWQDQDSRVWHERPGALSGDERLPWTRVVGPRELGAACVPDSDHAAAYLFVDFFDLEAGRALAARLPECPGAPRALDRESVRFAAERFKPQQVKRLGPGMLAAEILLPAAEVKRLLPAAARLVRNMRRELDAEVYYLADGWALVIAGYLTDHRSGGFAVDLLIAPALLDLAIRRCRGRPYVLGRWQAGYFRHAFGRVGAARLRAIRGALDPRTLLNRGVLTELRLRGALGALVSATFLPGVALVRAVYEAPILAWLARAMRALLSGFSGPAYGRGAPAVIGAPFRVRAPIAEVQGTRAAQGDRASGSAERSALLAIAPSSAGGEAGDAPRASARIPGTAGAPGPERRTAAPRPQPSSPAPQLPEDRALHCVNCGECNSVCPIFSESKIRLPQMLTHIGEAMRGGERIGPAGSTLLDLCMRCGNCEQVCQAGIPHLPLYERMQQASDRSRPRDVARHTAIVAAVRGSNRYLREFLDVRPGGYHKRTPASLPGVARFLVLRSENDAGPAATCIHCGACVPACPTHANREFEGLDPRWITTVQERCIGCGACVEVCPNNHQNGGQTLRVMEAPTRDWFAAVSEFESLGDHEPARARDAGVLEANQVHAGAEPVVVPRDPADPRASGHEQARDGAAARDIE